MTILELAASTFDLPWMPSSPARGWLFYENSKLPQARDWIQEARRLRSIPAMKQSRSGSVRIDQDLVLKSWSATGHGRARAWRRGLRLFQVSTRLQARAIQAPVAIALGCSDSGQEVELLMERAPGLNADAELAALDPRGLDRHRWLDSLAARVAAWHEAGVFHGDLKAANLVISAAGPCMVDYAQASFDPFFPLFHAGRDLGQLISSLAPWLRRSGALELLDSYAEHRRFGPIRRERIWQLALARARKRAARSSVPPQDWFFQP